MNNLRFADQTGFMFNTFIAANMVVYFLLIFRKKNYASQWNFIQQTRYFQIQYFHQKLEQIFLHKYNIYLVFLIFREHVDKEILYVQKLQLYNLQNICILNLHYCRQYKKNINLLATPQLLLMEINKIFYFRKT